MGGSVSTILDDLESAIEETGKLAVGLLAIKGRPDVPHIHRVQLDNLARSMLGVENGLKRIWEQNRREALRLRGGGGEADVPRVV
jgi:hypothetical protein